MTSPGISPTSLQPVEEAQSKRARELLRNYYGIKTATSNPGTPRDTLGTPLATPVQATQLKETTKPKNDAFDIGELSTIFTGHPPKSNASGIKMDLVSIPESLLTKS
jgi:hypothetical protein